VTSKRQRIVDALIERMQLIKGVNGYRTDIGEDVHDWEIHFQQEDIGKDGAISVCDMPAEAVNSEGRSNPQETIWKMPVQIRCFFGRDVSPKIVRDAIADINDAIRLDDRLRVDGGPGLVMISRPLREGVVKPQDSFELMGGIVEFEVQYITKKFNSEE